MKKMMMALTMVALMITSSAFANEVNVSQQVLKAFKTDFVSAQDVTWSTSDTHFKASFTMNNERVFAYYSCEGELIALARYITSLQLPLTLQTNLKKSLGDKWVTDLFEVSNEEGVTYFITLEDADNKVQMKSTSTGGWNTYKRTNKV